MEKKENKSMSPVNSKSLLAFTFAQMTKLEDNSIDVETAKAQSNLIKQANNLLKYELDRAKTIMQLKQHNRDYNDDLSLRNIESKNFD